MSLRKENERMELETTAERDSLGHAVAPESADPWRSTNWPLRSYLALGPLPTAVPCARLHTRQVLWEWGLHDVADTAELLVSELITNGVKASGALPHRPPVWLGVSAAKGRVLIEVGDGSPEQPEPPPSEDGIPGLGQESGRGLFLVACLSEQWNWYPSQDDVGKVVWCLLTVPQRPESEQGEATVLPQLPRRVRRPMPVSPARSMTDPAVLQLLRDGLLDLDMDRG